jgi:hypothetical protein
MDRCKVIAPRRFEDERGFFMKLGTKNRYWLRGLIVSLCKTISLCLARLARCEVFIVSDRPTRRPSLFAAHAVGCLMWLLMFAKAAPISDAGLPKSSALRMADSFSFLQGFCMDL